MTHFSSLFCSFSLLALPLLSACQTTPLAEDTLQLGPVASISDFKVLVGKPWSGSLTYLDYSSGKSVTIPAEATLETQGQDTIRVTISYPDEPWEDTKETFKLSKDGRKIDGHTLIARSEHNLRDLSLEDNFPLSMNRPDIVYTRLMTEHSGKDNNTPASIRMSYILNEYAFGLAKDIKTEGAQSFTNRNFYKFTRKN